MRPSCRRADYPEQNNNGRSTYKRPNAPIQPRRAQASNLTCRDNNEKLAIEASRCNQLLGAASLGRSYRFYTIDRDFTSPQLLRKRRNQFLHITFVCSRPQSLQSFPRSLINMHLA